MVTASMGGFPNILRIGSAKNVDSAFYAVIHMVNFQWRTRAVVTRNTTCRYLRHKSPGRGW